MKLSKLVLPILSALASITLGTGEVRASEPFTAFESGQVRPLTISPNGKRLFALNTPDNRLEIYRITNEGLEHLSSVPVGLEPVAVAARNNNEVWVVNHLSDSVSVVRVGPKPYIARTLQVGDEPRDIVFGGPEGDRAFITAAHRGQSAPFDPELTSPGIGRADVWVFDADDKKASAPLTILNLFCDTPRALAVSPDGSTVYAAAFNSGNQTATVAPGVITDEGEEAGGLPAPNVHQGGDPEPDNGLIVRFDGEHWVDELDRIWDDQIKFDLPDEDVFVIDATSPIPSLAGEVFTGVGTTLFNMVVNPVSGALYVTNTEARNHVRFEGPGILADTTVRGHAVDNRITILDPELGSAEPRLLNKHIDYDQCCAPTPNAVSELSVSQPLDMAISSDGAVLYTAVLGNDKVAVYYTGELDDDSFYPDTFDQIPVSGGGPTGVALDEARDRLYVLTRFDNGISIIDTAELDEVDHLTMHNPEPASIVEGRRFLYDATATSSNGDQSCASCHIFGDKDDLAWDLGNPDGDILPVVDIIKTDFGLGDIDYHPMKGPMTTQSLRGLDNHGPMHWRGDRNGAGGEPSVQPDTGAYDEVAAFNAFNVAFEGLIGRDEPLDDEQMQAFTDFALQLMYPPNPIRNLDNSLTPQQQAGRDFFFTAGSVFVPAAQELRTCESCHRIDAEANAEFGVPRPGFFGTDGQVVIREIGQTIKIPHMRNLYTKIGAFGYPDGDFLFNGEDSPFYDISHQGDQIRGFGFAHDGSKSSILRILNAFRFAPEGFQDLDTMEAVASFLMVMDTNLAPVVGQQVTLRKAKAEAWWASVDRVALLRERAEVGECELIAKGRLGPFELGLLYADGAYTTSFSDLPELSEGQVQVLSWFKPVTFTCVPPGSGQRLGLDRDSDGILDGDEQLL